MERLIKNITAGLQLGQHVLGLFSTNQLDDVTENVYLGVGAMMPNEFSATVSYEMATPQANFC